MTETNSLTFRIEMNHSAQAVLTWHHQPQGLKRATPPWEKIQLTRSNVDNQTLHISWKPFYLCPSWTGCIDTHYASEGTFQVTCKRGERVWYTYQYQVVPQGDHHCELIEHIEYSKRAMRWLPRCIKKRIEKRIARMIRYKHAVLAHDLELLERYPFDKPLKVLVSGSRGLIGSHLCDFLLFAGHDVWRLTRKPKGHEAHQLSWDLHTGEMVAPSSESHLEGFDAVINLAGENVGKGRWTNKKKERIFQSRVSGTTHLVNLLKRLKTPPELFINASAIGYYGDRGDAIVTEATSSAGDAFITTVSQSWECAAKELETAGVRVILARFGIVMSAAGGALKKMVAPAKWGLLGEVGQGTQYMSWIAVDDVIGALYHCILTPEIRGAVNIVAPHPLSNRLCVHLLTKQTERWVGPPIPKWVVSLVFGQQGRELLLMSTRVQPRRLLDTGYHFNYPTLQAALDHVM